MAEFVGLGYYAEIPTVIYDVRSARGPRPRDCRRALRQGDVLSVATLSHGDTFHPMYFPASPEEGFSMSLEAFNLAEKFQTPVSS